MTYLNSSIDNQIDNNNILADSIASASLGIDQSLFASLNFADDGYEAYLAALQDISEQS